MTALAARFSVTGRVQGVAFRAYTRQKALQLGLTGYARNLHDGSVEVLALGLPQALAELERWLHQGSPAARVDGVRRSAALMDAAPEDGFLVE